MLDHNNRMVVARVLIILCLSIEVLDAVKVANEREAV